MKTLQIALAVLVAGATQLYAQQDVKIVSKYDFLPGEKIVFFDDFSAEAVGDFPAAWNTSGSGEIVTMEKYPGRWFQMTKGGFYIPEARENFSENYTLEFDFVPLATTSSEFMFSTEFLFISGTLDNPNENGAVPGKAGTKLSLNYDEVSWTNYSEKDGGYKDQGSSVFQFRIGEKYHVAFWIQKQRLRMYANESKVLDLPRGLITGYTYNIFRIQTSDEVTPAVANFRIAAGLPDMRNKLLTEGKLITYGIQFDVNSDKIKPESYATLKEIAQVMKDNPTLKVKITGFTDSDGEDASNLDLSKRRAFSVKAELSKQFGVEDTRMETDGKGEGQPLAPNDNAVNKAKNRRVEFVRINS
jgi:OOP family OmpA-OmpF porin